MRFLEFRQHEPPRFRFLAADVPPRPAHCPACAAGLPTVTLVPVSDAAGVTVWLSPAEAAELRAALAAAYELELAELAEAAATELGRS